MNSRFHHNRQPLESAATPSQDPEYLAAVDAGDFETVLRLTKNIAMRADMMAQAEWLLHKAIAAGYRSLEALAEADPKRYEKWSAEWRLAHAADFSHEEPELSGRSEQDTPDPQGKPVPHSQRFFIAVDPCESSAGRLDLDALTFAEEATRGPRPVSRSDAWRRNPATTGSRSIDRVSRRVGGRPSPKRPRRG